MADVLSIALAMQLLGLTDVLNDPQFWNNGGWFQPVTSTGLSNTLPVVVQRVSLVGISWLTTAFVGNGLSVTTTIPTTTKMVQLLLFFAVTLGVLEGAVQVATSADLLWDAEFVSQTFQLWYFTAIALVAGRYVVRRLPF